MRCHYHKRVKLIMFTKKLGTSSTKQLASDILSVICSSSVSISFVKKNSKELIRAARSNELETRMLDVLYDRYTFLLMKTIPLKIIITNALKAMNKVIAPRHVKELSPIFNEF